MVQVNGLGLEKVVKFGIQKANHSYN